MRLSVLMENTACGEAMLAEHGLSLYLETGGRRILFDMGQTDAFAQNAQQMGVDLAQVDLAVLSHGHYDHGGGLARFLQINPCAPVYVSRHAFGAHYHGQDRYIGLDPALKGHERLIPVGEELQLDDALSLHACNQRSFVHPIESWGLTIENGQGFMPETFLHEQYLLVREGGRRILVSGCAHKGIINLAHWFDPDVIIGGFHLVKVDVQSDAGREKLDDVVRQLMDTRARFYTGHCTGDAVYQYMKQQMGSRLEAIHAGHTMEI